MMIQTDKTQRQNQGRIQPSLRDRPPIKKVRTWIRFFMNTHKMERSPKNITAPSRPKSWAVPRYVTHFRPPMFVTIYGKAADEARLKTESQCGGARGKHPLTSRGKS